MSEKPEPIPSRSERLTEIEAWWPLVGRILLFLLGATMIMFELFTGGDREFVFALGAALCSPAGVQILGDLVNRGSP